MENAVCAGKTKESVWKISALVLYGLLISVRDPWLLLHGRVWAEEGTVYLYGAAANRPWVALFQPHLGYYALWPNLCGILAFRIFPLTYAALVLVWCAFAIQLLAGYLTLDCEAFGNPGTKVAALSILLFAAPSRQIWLNTINSQFYLAVCAVLVFLSQSDRKVVLRTSVLAVAILTGPDTVLLAPFFIWRAFRIKTRGARIQASVLFAGGLIQIAIILASIHNGIRRPAFKATAVPVTFLIHYILTPFLSRTAKRIAVALILHHATYATVAGHSWLGHLKVELMSVRLPQTAPFLLLWALCDLAFLALLLWLTRDRKDLAGATLIWMALALALLSMYGALGGTAAVGERYVFPSSVLLGWAVLFALRRLSSTRPQRAIATVLLLGFVMAGVGDYFSYKRWERFVIPDTPDWANQVKAWRADPSHPLTVWPKGFGSVQLPPPSLATPSKPNESPGK
jgi:hypothetical protein